MKFSTTPTSFAHFNLPEKFGTLHPFQTVKKQDGWAATSPGKYTMTARSNEEMLLLAKEMIDRYLDG